MRRHLFDLHAARGRCHEGNLARRAPARCRDTALYRGQRLFDQQPLHHAPFRAGLVRNQRHAKNLLGQQRGFGGVFRDLDAATLPAPAGVNLRFDNDTSADVFAAASASAT